MRFITWLTIDMNTVTGEYMNTASIQKLLQAIMLYSYRVHPKYSKHLILSEY